MATLSSRPAIDEVGASDLIHVSSGGTSYKATGEQIAEFVTANLATVAIANGGTGATSASAARTSLGLVIGTNVQAYDAELAAVAGLTSTADALPYFTGSGTASTATLTSFARTILDDANQAAARTTLGLTPGTDVQAYDVELAALAGLTSAANKVPYFTGSGTATVGDFTSFGRSLVDDADASTARTTLALGTIATQASSSVTVTGGTIDAVTIGGTTPVSIRGYAPVNDQTGTTYTLALTDSGTLVTLTNGSAITLTVPNNTTIAFPVGSEVYLAQEGAGTVTVAAAGGVTINSLDGNLDLAGQYAGATLKRRGTNIWWLVGGIA